MSIIKKKYNFTKEELNNIFKNSGVFQGENIRNTILLNISTNNFIENEKMIIATIEVIHQLDK